MNYFMCWLRDFIRNKRLLILGIFLVVVLNILNEFIEIPLEMKSFYILAVSLVTITIYTIIFFALKQTIIVKAIYGFALFVVNVFIIISLLEIFNIVDLVQYVQIR